MSTAVETFLRAPLPAGGPAWVHELRTRGAERFRALGLPTTRNEDWRYTSVEPIAAVPFAAAQGIELARAGALLARFGLGEAGPERLTFVDGRLAPELSRGGRAVALGSVWEHELVRTHLGGADVERHGFLALNAAFVDDGAFVHVRRGERVEAPIELVFVTTERVQPTVSHLRNLVVLEAGAEATVVEHYVGGDNATSFTNVVTELVLAEDAGLTHVKLQREGASSFHVATVQARQARSSRLASWSVALGGQLARTEVHTALLGEGADARLFGAYAPTGRQLVDHHTFIDHAAPRCTSNELYKGVLGGMARGVFNGKILVRRDAQKTAAFQSNRNLLLSEGAVVDTRPQLEIYADDVKCSHGATIGRLDDEALFYLRSRGLDLAEARRLLTAAFAAEVLEGLPTTGLREQLGAALSERLGVLTGVQS